MATEKSNPGKKSGFGVGEAVLSSGFGEGLTGTSQGPRPALLNFGVPRETHETGRLQWRPNVRKRSISAPLHHTNVR